MAEVKFKGPVTTGNNKPVNTLKEALKIKSVCDPCGCDADLSFMTLTDLNTTDSLFLVFVHDGTVHAIADNATNRANFEECCRERAAGASGTACDALVA